MSEMRAAVTHHHFIRHAKCRKRVAFKRIRFNFCRVRHVKAHIHQRRGQIFGCVEALLKGRCRFDFLNQRCRDRFTSLIVNEVIVDHFVGEQPALKKLRLELCVVANAAI